MQKIRYKRLRAFIPLEHAFRGTWPATPLAAPCNVFKFGKHSRGVDEHLVDFSRQYAAERVVMGRVRGERDQGSDDGAPASLAATA